MQQKKFSDNILDDIQAASDRVKADDFKITPQDNLSFGIKYLDEVTGGIRKNDFFILGASTGAGKSECAKIIAYTNAKNKKRVHFFALEAEQNEIEMRIKYSLLSRVAYEFHREQFPDWSFNYTDYINGRYTDTLGKYDEEINAIIGDTYGTLNTYYEGEDNLNETNIEKTILSIKDQTDLIIIDHLHYFRFDDENENRATKSLMYKLKELSKDCGKPIVAIAHLRKKDNRAKSIVPSLDDFHGSSDITKICTRAIVLSRCRQIKYKEPYLLATYISVLKNRIGGDRARQIAVCGFDLRTNSYEDRYYIGEISQDGENFEAEKNKTPYWAKSAQLLPDAQIPFVETRHRKPLQRQRVDLDN